MTERLTTEKTTATGSRSERLNASRNKQAGDEKAEKQKKAAVSVLSLAPCYKWVKQKQIFRGKLLGSRKLVGSKQR